jgi:hypothetical protein
MALVDSTVVRNMRTTAVLVGPSSAIGALGRVASAFEAAYVQVVSAETAATAGERLAALMPQVVVVLGALQPDERSDLTDRATAVGALLLHIDPELDTETLDELVQRAVRTAVERRVRSEEDAGKKEPSRAPSDPPGDEVDEDW